MTTSIKSKTGWYRDDATGGFWISTCCVGREKSRGISRGRVCSLRSCDCHWDPNWGHPKRLTEERPCEIAHCACHGPSSTYRSATEEELAVMWKAKRDEEAARAADTASRVATLLPGARISKGGDCSTYIIHAQLPNGIGIRLVSLPSTVYFTHVEAPCPSGRFSPESIAAIARQLGKLSMLLEMP